MNGVMLVQIISDTSYVAPPPRRRASILIRLAMVLLATLTAFALGEGAVRLLGVDRVRAEVGAVPHPLWHHWHRPNHEFDYHVSAEGYSQRVCFNSLGMRDSREVNVAKPPRVRRIAVLGDSFVEAMQVSEEEGVCRRLELELRAAGQPRVEVLNFGCSGFSSTLEMILAREWLRSFSPDLVICLHHFSDMTEDWSFAARARRDGNRIVAIEPTTTAAMRSFRQTLEVSQLFRVAHGSFDRWRRHRPPRSDASLKDSFDAIVHDPYSAADLEAWDYSLAGVAEMAAMFRDGGVPFLLMIVPIGPQVEPVDKDYAAALGFRFLAGGAKLEHRGYQDKMTGFCREQGIECLDLLDSFREANPGGRPWLYLPRDQHWSGAGHDLAARLIAERLLSAPRK